MSDRYFNRQGQAVTSDEWAASFKPEVQKVAATDIVSHGETVTVSTVWLGLNHNWGDGPPLIFETMVFRGPLDEEQVRYSTEAEAIAGHAAMCARVRAS